MALKGTWLLVYDNKKTDFGISFDSHGNDISKVMISFDISCLQIGVGLKTSWQKTYLPSIYIWQLIISLMV